MINGYWLGLAFVPAGGEVQRKGQFGYCCAIRLRVDDSLSSSLRYRLLISPVKLLSVVIAIKVIEDTLMIRCHELPVAVAYLTYSCAWEQKNG
jgi:hypothetical protein